jgi:hypothetical protein
MEMSALDGNATAGELADLFTFDTTMAVTVCAGCRRAAPMADLRAYVDAPGMVLRCSSCDAAQLRLVRSNDRAWLDLRGVEAMEIHMRG